MSSGPPDRGAPRGLQGGGGGAGIWRESPGHGARAAPGWGSSIWHQLAPGRCPATNQLRRLLPWRWAAILSLGLPLRSGLSHGAPGRWHRGPQRCVPSSGSPSGPQEPMIFFKTAQTEASCLQAPVCHLLGRSRRSWGNVSEVPAHSLPLWQACPLSHQDVPASHPGPRGRRGRTATQLSHLLGCPAPQLLGSGS